MTQATQDPTPLQELSIEESTEKEVKTVQEPIMREQNEKEDQFSGFDLVSDTSLQRFLSDNHPFSDPQYIPEDLAPIESDFTTNAARKFQLRKEA